MSHTRESLVIKNGFVLLPDGTLTVCDVLIKNGSIQSIDQHLSADRSIDATGLTVLPGLIDIHTHGIGRVSTDEGSLEEYARIEASRGTTTFYPTLFCSPKASIGNLTRFMNETDNLKTVPQIAGFRLDSPYLAQTGAGISRDLAPISRNLTHKLLDAGKGHIKIWDISPELDGAPDCIHELSERGIICSIAHTRASIKQAREAVDAGARLVTHLFDTFVLPDDANADPGVYPAGLVDYLLVEDRVNCEIIGDGTHVHPLLVEKAFRCKQPEKLAFVTDSNYGAGLPSGTYFLPGNWGNVKIDGCNNGVRLIDRGLVLAGSALTPIDGFRNAVMKFNKDIATASRVCSETPAKLLGLNKGQISLGKDGDIILIDSEFNIQYTIAGGSTVYVKN